MTTPPTFRVRLLDRVTRTATWHDAIEAEPPRDLPILDLLDMRDEAHALNARAGFERYRLEDMDALEPDADPADITPRD
jgi:hypothetical protein|uniref:Uncharacterized protein n=1 Tax=Acrobeloides nanus TaxID=290746 RepID=A0A914DGB4_9BILA